MRISKQRGVIWQILLYLPLLAGPSCILDIGTEGRRKQDLEAVDVIAAAVRQLLPAGQLKSPLRMKRAH